MQLDDLLALLPPGESIDLDYKRTFPPGYFDKSDARYLAARAELVKDVAAMANAASERPGHLVFGIADQNGARAVHPVPRTAIEDDARLADLFDKYLDPPPNFEYTEVTHEGQMVGLLRVHRAMPYPHVIRESLGGTVHKGQVYVRKNSRNTVALHADLVQMIEGRKPIVLSLGSPEAMKVEEDLRTQGWVLSWVRIETLDQSKLGGAEHMYFPGTRRHIEAPGGLLAGQMYLLGRRSAPPKEE